MKIVIVAGGTGGHIYPALTLADELKSRGHNILFIGSSTRMEKDIIPSFDYEYIGLDILSTRGNIINKIKSLFSIISAYFKCKKIIKGYDVAIGFGNYISLPVIFAAVKNKIKTIIHEQNYFAGKANLILDKKVDYVICSYDETLKEFKNKKSFAYGNPQSSKALSIKIDRNCIADLGLNQNKKTVVVFMGSLGSSSVDKILQEYFLKTDGSYQIIYARGNDNDSTIDNNKFGKHIVIKNKIDGIKYIMNCDLVISRSGATTISEIIACGTPSILIPSPYVPSNHQYYNASLLEKNGGAIVIEERNLNANVLNDTVNSIINNEDKMKMMSLKSKELLKNNIMENFIGVIEK